MCMAWGIMAAVDMIVCSAAGDGTACHPDLPHMTMARPASSPDVPHRITVVLGRCRSDQRLPAAAPPLAVPGDEPRIGPRAPQVASRCRASSVGARPARARPGRTTPRARRAPPAATRGRADPGRRIWRSNGQSSSWRAPDPARPAARARGGARSKYGGARQPRIASSDASPTRSTSVQPGTPPNGAHRPRRHVTPTSGPAGLNPCDNPRTNSVPASHLLCIHIRITPTNRVMRIWMQSKCRAQTPPHDEATRRCRTNR